MLPVAALACTLMLPPPAAPEPVIRADFVEAISTIERGMSIDQVRAVLGEPDDIVFEHLRHGIWDSHVDQLWRYGVDVHLDFPTLGEVGLSSHGTVMHIRGGGGAPPDPGLVSEQVLREILRLIDEEFGLRLWLKFDARRLHSRQASLIRVINRLLPLGKDGVLAVLGEYDRVVAQTPRDARPLLPRSLLTLLFEPLPRTEDATSPVSVYSSTFSYYPLVIVEDVPFWLNLEVDGVGVAGSFSVDRTEFRSLLEQCRADGVLRTRPLIPPDDPLRIVDRFEASPRWVFDADPAVAHNVRARQRVSRQLLSLVATVYRPPWTRRDLYDRASWRTHITAFDKIGAHWDRQACRYVLADGSTLPENRQYLQLEWRPRLPDRAVYMYLTRETPDRVGVHLRVEASSDAEPIPPATLRIVHVETGAILDEYEIDGNRVGRPFARIDWIRLGDGAGVRLSLTQRDLAVAHSAVYVP